MFNLLQNFQNKCSEFIEVVLLYNIIFTIKTLSNYNKVDYFLKFL